MKPIQHILDTEDGLGLAHYVKCGDVTPGELLEGVIERLGKVTPHINAVAETLFESAREAARKPQLPTGRFAGVPTLVKDLFTSVKEARMANGSLALGDAHPGLDDELVSRYRKAGIIIAGTSTSPEFGSSYTTESTRFGATRNPWNLAHSAGGSSGGAAALVAARVVPFAHGNDGGGSIRVPASCCGVFGLKPTRGRMPNGPLVGEGWAGMGVSHAITLSVRDSAALLDISAGSDLGAPYAAPYQSSPFLDGLSRPPGKLRIAMIEHLSPWTTSKQALESVRATAALCEQLGHHVEVVSLPVDAEQFYSDVFTIIGVNTQAYVDMLGHIRGQPVSFEELEPRTRVMLRERGRVPGTDYVKAVNAMHTLGRRFAHFMTQYDLILTPTLTQAPPLIGELDAFDDTLRVRDVIEGFHRYCPFTALFNATGQPAMSVPLYWTQEKLPIGSHFAARFGDEQTLLSLAAELERVKPWAKHIPSINALS